MYSTLLSNSEDSIFLEAVDQYFSSEDQQTNQDSQESDSILPRNYLINNFLFSIESTENSSFSEQNITEKFEKFYQNLDISACSTEGESEETGNSAENNGKKFILFKDFLIINEENLRNNKEGIVKRFNEYEKFMKKMREIFEDKEEKNLKESKRVDNKENFKAKEKKIKEKLNVKNKPFYMKNKGLKKM